MAGIKSDSFREFVLEQLQGVRSVACRAMFGGYGLYAGERFFGIIYKGRLYFKVSDTSREQYTSAGMKSFKPSAKMTLKSFYEVPADVLEDQDEIAEWVAEAIQAAKLSLRPKKLIDVAETQIKRGETVSWAKIKRRHHL